MMSPEVATMLQERERNIKLAIVDGLQAGQSFDTMESNVRASVANVMDSLKPGCNLCSQREACIGLVTSAIISDVIAVIQAVSV